MKIVVLDGYTENPGDLSWDALEALGELTVYEYTKPEEVAQRIAGAQAVYTNKTQLSRDIIMQAKDLAFIGVLATGYNIVDVAAAKERGIPVCNVPSYGTTAVAQFVFALLLEICHRVGHHNQAVQEGRWSKGRDFTFWDYPLIELAGKTMGIIGYGRIGRATAEIAKAFGMNILAYSPHGAGDENVDLDQLYSKSDVISLHCPLFPETERMINKEAIAKMKDGVIIINTSRGGLINEMDLREALLSKKVYGAGVDVVSREPITEDNPLLHLDNVLITPHIAWAPKESRQRLMQVAVENLRCYIAGAPQNVVNPL